MTTWDALAACGRRWYVVLAGLLVTCAVLAGLARADGVYSARVEVVFLAPATPAQPNRIASAATGVIATAGLVQRMVDPETTDGGHRAATSSMVSLVGRGIDDGEAVVLPDTGGQWAHGFDRPVLAIEVTGSSEADVLGRAAELVDAVRRTTHELQSDPRIDDYNEITTSLSPAVPQVAYQQGHTTLALAVALLLGVALSLVSGVSADRLLARRRRPRREL